jgi:16S rRNA processing protein RimM
MGRKVLIGAIGRPHGVRGFLRVQSFAVPPAAIAGYGVLSDEAGREYRLRLVSDGDMPVVRIDGVRDRDAAQRLTGTRLFAEREAFAPEAEDEFYHADLVGLRAEDAAGQVLGQVAAVNDFGAGAMLDIARSDGETLLLPFTRAAVPVVDLEGGRVVVELPAEIVVEPRAEPAA